MWAKKTVKAPFGIAVSETVCKVRSDTVIRTDRFKEERRLIATIVYYCCPKWHSISKDCIGAVHTGNELVSFAALTE